ncbi:hypothetical protein [Nocardioides piscis]|uniref:hypothetical protein n=1 Tax=Nocardioides piscis TaxID=2714938 RepID=UPI001FECAFEC|nr:hypothetical protein [Nocardioides piscis]
MAKDRKDTTKDKSEEDGGKRARGASAAAALRTKVAQVIWLVCVLCALALALGALLIALKANTTNSLVQFVLDAADTVDLGVFSMDDGIKQFENKKGKPEEIKNALVNYGLGAVAWLVVGRILDRIIRP